MNNIENMVGLLWDKVRNLENEILQVRDGTLGWETKQKARAYLSSAQDNIPDATWTKVTLDAETYDPGNNFNTTLNRFIAPVSGYYQVNGSVGWGALVTDKTWLTGIRVNGVGVTYGRAHSSHSGYLTVPASDIIHLNKDDYVELYCYQGSGEATADLLNSSPYTFMAVHLISRD